MREKAFASRLFVELGPRIRHGRVEVGEIGVEADGVVRGLVQRCRRLARIAEDEEGERLDPRFTQVLERRLDLLVLEALHHVAPRLLGGRLDAHGEHPAARLPQARDELGVHEVVGPGVAEPLHAEVPGDELVAESGERLGVQRDGVAPEVEVPDAELPGRSLDLVDERLRVTLAELVTLVDRRNAEVARVRAAAARLDDDVRLALEGQRVVRQRDQIPRRKRHRREPRERPVRAVGHDLVAEAVGQARDLGERLAVEARRRSQRNDGVLGLADDHRVHGEGPRHRQERRRRRVRPEAHEGRAEMGLQPRHLGDVRVECRGGTRKDDELGAESLGIELADHGVGREPGRGLIDQAELDTPLAQQGRANEERIRRLGGAEHLLALLATPLACEGDAVHGRGIDEEGLESGHPG